MDIYEIKNSDEGFSFREMSFDEVYKNPNEAEKDWLDFLKDGVKPWNRKKSSRSEKKSEK